MSGLTNNVNGDQAMIENIKKLLKDAKANVEMGEGKTALENVMLAMKLATNNKEGKIIEILETAKDAAQQARDNAKKLHGAKTEEEAAEIAAREAMSGLKKKKKKKKRKKKKKPENSKSNDSGGTTELDMTQRKSNQLCQAIIFDMDGLMIDSEPLWHVAEKETFCEHGIDLEEKDLLQTTGLRIDEVVEFNFKKFGKVLNKQIKDRVVENIVSRMETLLHKRGMALKKPGLDHILQYFKTKSIPLAVASSSPMRLIKAGLIGLNLFSEKTNSSATFSVIVSAEAEKLGKPHPGVYLTAATKLGVPPSSCFALEDSLNGCLAAKSAKMKCVAVPENFENRSLAFHIADVQISSLQEMNESIWNQLWPPVQNS